MGWVGGAGGWGGLRQEWVDGWAGVGGWVDQTPTQRAHAHIHRHRHTHTHTHKATAHTYTQGDNTHTHTHTHKAAGLPAQVGGWVGWGGNVWQCGWIVECSWSTNKTATGLLAQCVGRARVRGWVVQVYGWIRVKLYAHNHTHTHTHTHTPTSSSAQVHRVEGVGGEGRGGAGGAGGWCAREGDVCSAEACTVGGSSAENRVLSPA